MPRSLRLQPTVEDNAWSKHACGRDLFARLLCPDVSQSHDTTIVLNACMQALPPSQMTARFASDAQLVVSVG